MSTEMWRVRLAPASRAIDLHISEHSVGVAGGGNDDQNGLDKV